jgi:hypothetical protein
VQPAPIRPGLRLLQSITKQALCYGWVIYCRSRHGTPLDAVVGLLRWKAGVLGLALLGAFVGSIHSEAAASSPW